MFLLSGAMMLLAFHEPLRHLIADWLIQSNFSFLLVGALLFCFATVLAFSFWMMEKGSYLRIKMRNHTAIIQEQTLRKSIHLFWKEHYPNAQMPSEIYCAKQRIEIVAPGKGQDLKAIEKELSAFFAEKLGYQNEFFVSITDC